MAFPIGVCLAYILIQLWQEWTILRYHSEPLPHPESWPEITVMVAARNEETNIRQCLEALLSMNYPADKMNILLGNDQSTDRTAEMALELAEKDGRVRVIDIVEDDSGLKAKARVMAQLDKHATGTFYLITDADVCVNPDWAAHMVCQMKEGVGVASGTTMVEGQGCWAKMQELDWTYFMGLLNVISYNGVPATAVGNNMIVRSEAYWQTGGYASIRFSITEDYRLYSEICRKGWKWNNVMSPGSRASSLPVHGFLNLLHQRKRWLSGGRELPWYWWVLFGIFALYYLSIPLILFLQPAIAVILIAVKFILQTLQINGIYRHLGKSYPNPLNHIAYELYLYMVTLSTALFFILPLKTRWKGRYY